MVAYGRVVIPGSGNGETVTWSSLSGKPSTFPPSTHSHAFSDVTGKPSTYPPETHSHTVTWASVTGKPTTFPPAAHDHTFASITEKPTAYPPETHEHPEYEGGGGGGGSTRVSLHGYVKTGDVPAPGVQDWGIWPGTPTVSIPAVVGDEIQFDYAALFAYGSSTFFDTCVIVGGAPVRYASTGTSSPAPEGDPSLYPEYSFYKASPIFVFTATADDISGGNVTIGFAIKSNGTTAKLYASNAYPLRWQLTNWGQ